MSLVHPILEYGSACWHPCREGQINAFDRAQKKAVQFTNRTKYSDWENLAQRMTLTCLCAPLKAFSGEWTWKAICDRLRKPCYLIRVGHVHLDRKKQNVTLQVC